MSSGRWCVTYETRPCNLEAETSGFLGKQSAGEEDDAEQDVNAVVGLAELEWTNHPHSIRRLAEGHAQDSKRHVNDAEYEREGFRR